jgi:hypothetical protein
MAWFVVENGHQKTLSRMRLDYVLMFYGLLTINTTRRIYMTQSVQIISRFKILYIYILNEGGGDTKMMFPCVFVP